MYYRIGEFAKLGGVSIKTLRFYDQIGLLRPRSVDARTSYRWYAPEQLRDLSAIHALQDLGASLKDIALALSGDDSGPARLRLLTRLRRDAVRSLAAARQSLAWIDSALEEMGQERRAIPVVLKRRESLRVASVRACARNYDEIGDLERDLRKTVAPDIAGRVQGVLWHRCAASGVIEGEPFVQVDARVRRCSDYEVKELPSATFATAYCEPTDRDAERVYEAVDRWIHLHEFELAGAKREIYVGQILEVQFPVKTA